MDLKQIKYFIAAAEQGSISGAAARVRIAQPAVGAQIARLEAELDVVLFVRHTRGISLTPSGKIFLKHAYEILEKVSSARSALTDMTSQPSGEVIIGLPATTSAILSLPLIDGVRNSLPAVDLKIVEGLSGDILTWLRSGRLDLAILYEADHIPDIRVTPLVSDDLFLIGDSHPATEGRSDISFPELAKFPIIHTTRAHALRILLDATSRNVGCVLQFVSEVDSITQIGQLVARGSGYTILPKVAVRPDVLGPSTRLIHITSPTLRLRSYLALAPGKQSLRAVDEVFTLTAKLVSDLVAAKIWPGGHTGAPTLTIHSGEPTPPGVVPICTENLIPR
jgi:LysR family nitrogen assimilation transcriptional regulator